MKNRQKSTVSFLCFLTVEVFLFFFVFGGFASSILSIPDHEPYQHCSLFPAIGILAAPVVLLAWYDITLENLVSEYERNLLHNPSTGYMYGAEPRDLGPVDSPLAALLVHGFVGAGDNFGELPERLASEGIRVRVMRLPGHGTTPRDMVGITADTLLTAVRKELRILREHHESVTLIGHSMGATLCAIIAAEGGAENLVLCAPYFRVSHKWYYILSPETWVDLTKPVVRWVRKGNGFIMVNRKEAKGYVVSYRYVPINAVDMLNRLGERGRSGDILTHITCPVLVIHSRGDDAASFEASVRAFHEIKSTDKRFISLERSNHHVFCDYEREEVISEIVKFCVGKR